MTFTVPTTDYERACAVLNEHRGEIAVPATFRARPTS